MQSKLSSSPEMFGEIVSQALTEAFRACCTPALETSITSAEPEIAPADQEAVRFSMRMEGSLQGSACLAIKKTDIPALGMQAETSTPETEAAALLNLLQTMAPRLQDRLTHQYGAVTVTVEPAAQTLQNGSALQLAVRFPDGDMRATLYLYLETQLITRLQSSAGVLFSEAAPAAPPPMENLDLVMDVELNATLRFGQRQLSLREILDLTSGSVVELDRQVDEPVELILDGRVIARGEAVIIDGNYGMRITEILQPVQSFLRPR